MGERSKYNVDRNAEKRTYDGIVFDSIMEMRFYRDVILPGMENGEITKCELQKPYTLQPGFTHEGVKVRPVTYVADFYYEDAHGGAHVIDVKGTADSLAKCKRKLFWYRYPELDYRWVTYVKKYGGWRDWDEVQRMRRSDRRALKLKEETGNGEEQEDNV